MTLASLFVAPFLDISRVFHGSDAPNMNNAPLDVVVGLVTHFALSMAFGVLFVWRSASSGWRASRCCSWHRTGVRPRALRRDFPDHRTRQARRPCVCGPAITSTALNVVTEGLTRSGRIVTTAAALIVLQFFAIGTATVSLLLFGLGAGFAVVVDATLVRAVLVPAAQRLLGRGLYAPRTTAPAPETRRPGRGG